MSKRKTSVSVLAKNEIQGWICFIWINKMES
jgi:hypothetical protein